MEGKYIYRDYTDSVGNLHKLKIGWIPEQSEIYKKELAKGDKADGVVLHYSHLPTIMYPPYRIEDQIRFIELPHECERRAEFRMLEMKMKETLSEIKKPKREFSIFSFLIFNCSL